jgi:hypothetical protein
MWLPTKDQVDAASRHAISIAGTAVVIFGLQAKGFSAEQLAALIKSLGDTVNSAVVLIGAALPIYAALMASHKSSATQQIAKVQAIATSQTPQSQQAKVALLDATASLPEVVDPIGVTDQKLVDQTESFQVVKTKGMVS